MTRSAATSPLVEVNNKKGGNLRLPWWTWVLPFFVANLGTWLSLWAKTNPGASLWYLPTAFGIVMAYWWGPRVLVGIYLNALICAPLWDLPWQWSFLYALPETLEVGLSWLFFVRLAGAKYWLPDLRSVGYFLLFGSLIPTFGANAYLVTQLYLLGDISLSAIWLNWQVLFSADLVTQFVFSVPALVLFTQSMMEKGWTESRVSLKPLPLLPRGRDTRLDKTFLIAVFILLLIVISIFPIHDRRGLFGLALIFIAIRYGVQMAVLTSSWIGLLAFLLPVALKSEPGISSASYVEFLTTNFDILFLCGVTLVTGRAITDLTIEVNEHRQAEDDLQKAETQFRTLVEQIPPIIYIAAPRQGIGVTYISPRIETLGFTVDEWIADPQHWVRQLHPDDRRRILDLIEKNRDVGGPFQAEYRLIARDGSVRWFMDEAADVTDSSGRHLFRQGFMLDITQRKQVEESLSAREQYLELLNSLTHTILLSEDFDSTFHSLAFDLRNVVDADDCYIIRWDEEKQLPIPVTTTASLDFPFSEATESGGIVAAILRAGNVIVIEDVHNSPYVKGEVIKRYPAKSVIGIPLITRNQKLGVAIIAFNSRHSFSQEEIDRAAQAGNQIALALWNFRQSVEIQQKLKENQALAKIERTLSESERTGTGEVLQLIVDSARELMPHAEQSVIHLLDPEEQALFAHAVSGFDEREQEYKGIKMRLGEGIAGQVMNEGVTINIGDIRTHPRFVTSKSVPGFRSLLVAPVQSGSSHIGTISIQSSQPNVFTKNDAELLKTLAIQAAVALENTRLFEATQQSLKEVNILYQISRELALSLDSDQLIRDMIGLLQQIFDYYYVQIYLIDPETQNLVIKHGSGQIGSELIGRSHNLPAGEGIVGHVAETGEPFVTNNVDEVVFFKRHPLLSDTQYEIAVPIKIDRQVIGVLDIQQTPPRRFSENDLNLMTAIADHFAIVLQKANLYRDLQVALQQEQMVRSQLVQSERLALVGRLLASVSHELNNPLQAIQNALFLLREEKNLSVQAGQDLDVILAEAERMAALIERLRSAYRPMRMQDFQPVGLNSLIEDVHTLISTHMRHKMIAFEFLPDPELPHVSGLPDQLRQVVLNLFLNAIEIMKPGGCLSVQTQSLVAQAEVLLTVKDTGPGIDSEILPHIFDAFITTKHTGTGLGLTITHDIIQQHHGRITAENDPAGGALFNVWLPIDERGEA